ncbi:F0F1 ATP synthase subunit A [Ohtaekwangia koreensis]|jgi:F-type H+-transporting ATPase subunit a|uniref:ATP synthase subunit a n=1 Tax=Ohtaekwangia koreensis TaxID=688867 RepID=A0A1T5LKC2_9BACT|nr:F0F1 ATP synthase subunit A [Ohtaekwangia koreensis]SKC76447.1 F-type H+-transporting ATPase subunit a [Ohtaekwangia koreensis]
MSVSSSILRRISILSLLFVLLFSGAKAQEEPMPEFNDHESTDKKEFNASEVILHHVMDDHIWHLFDGHYGTIYLPVIVYSSEKGLDVFSSRNFYGEHHNVVEYNGYKLEHNHIYLADSNKAVFDLSITKNVAMLFINAALLVIVFLAVAKGYKKNKGKAPSGIQSFFEPIILFVRDEVVKPNIGHHYEKFFPYLLTLFFFILFGNLIGLLPGAGNLTGNIAVTLSLALLTFIITNVNGNKAYWSHIFWTPGVPLPLRLVILPVEIIGIFTKPISLTIRLFVAITAGHIVLLSLISLAFIFGSIWVGFGSSIIVLFISLIELLVAGIQAYVFTLFTSLYIGMAIADHDHH